MKEKIIENWLTKASERAFQIPFCQTLAYKGHKVTYISSHGQLEEGKDVISEDEEGNLYCYQLKQGNINLPEWRDIKGEIEELVELEIKLPGIEKKRPYKPILVTSGRISDPVRMRIVELNSKWKEKGYSELEIYQQDELVKLFVESSGSFFPENIRELNLLLNIAGSNGSEILPIDIFAEFLGSLLPKDQNIKYPKKVVEAVAASNIIVNYSLQSFIVSKNWYALFEGYTLLYCAVRSFLAYQKVPAKKADESISLLIKQIAYTIESLIEEAISRSDLLEGELCGDGAEMYRVRATILMGLFTAYSLACDKLKAWTNKVQIFIEKYLSTALLWGESAIPFLLSIMAFLESIGDKKKARDLRQILFKSVIEKSAIEGLAGPYVRVDMWLGAVTGMPDAELDLENFVGRLATLGTLLDIVVRRDERLLISELWKPISHIMIDEFNPNSEEAFFSWRTKDGTNDQEALPITGSWKTLQDNARNRRGYSYLGNDEKLLWLVLLVMPFRCTRHTLALLDSATQ